jgi:TPR repeat protein
MLNCDLVCSARGPAAGNLLFELGMMYSVGRDMPVDLIAAHNWFKLAAIKGNRVAVRSRREIACLMSDAEIAVAQRATSLPVVVPSSRPQWSREAPNDLARRLLSTVRRC